VGSQRNELLADLRSMINNNVMEISIKGQWVVIGSAVGGHTVVEGRTVFVLELCIVPASNYRFTILVARCRLRLLFSVSSS
jgi:hypothetical protein